MSRKAREDKSSWKMPSIDVFVGDYSNFNCKGFNTIDKSLLWLHYGSRTEDGRHTLHSMAGCAQEFLLLRNDGLDDRNLVPPRFRTIISINLKDMFEEDSEFEATLEKEIEEVNLTKTFGKTLVRLVQRMLLKDTIFAAEKELCPLLIKLYQAIHSVDKSIISEVWLLHPEISTKFINNHLVSLHSSNNGGKRGNKSASLPRFKLVVENEKNNRYEVLKHFFPNIEVLVIEQSPKNWFYIIGYSKDSPSEADNPFVYDSDCYCAFGKQLFLTHVMVEMNKHSKQYERNCEDVTSSLDDIILLNEEDKDGIDGAAIDWSTAERHVGALILRGTKCVLVRSITKEWEGMRIPYVLPFEDESHSEAAIRAVEELAEVDAEEVDFLPFISPVSLYVRNSCTGGQPILVQLYPMYAVNPPPYLDDPEYEEDPDSEVEEDEDDPYDWYSYRNATKVLDSDSISALTTMIYALDQASHVGLVARKWGGLFGQEETQKEECCG